MLTEMANSARIAQIPAIGRSAILCSPDFTGTVVRIKRENEGYFSVAVREVQGAFSGIGQPVRAAVVSQVWFDSADGCWVVDHREGHDPNSIEDDRTYSIGAALGVAMSTAAQRGHEAGRW
jgi:hypothetical protein